MIIHILSYACISLGLIFWFWGTPHLLRKRSVLFKLHSLSIADTLGSMSIVFGLLLKIPDKWPLLTLALLSLMLWNTMLGYVLAYCSTSDDSINNDSTSDDSTRDDSTNYSTREVSHD